MNPRNTNQVSEANALRYIPYSVIEPFGCTDIPTLMYDRKPILEELERELGNIRKQKHTDIYQLLAIIKNNHGVNIKVANEHGYWKITFDLPFTDLNFEVKINIK